MTTNERWHAPYVLPVVMSLGSFAWSFVYVSLPFHILRLSTLDEAATLRWTGWILGISSLVTVVTAPLWGRVGGRGNPKPVFVLVQGFQGVAFFGTALARTLVELFLARLLLGFAGAVSTLAFIGASRSTDSDAVRREVAAIQSGMTIGQVLGPLVGAIAAARLGFRASFVVGGLILIACSALAHWGVPDPPPPRATARVERRAGLWEIGAVALIVLGGSTQVFFLTSILPQVMPELGIEAERTLEIGGVIVFVSGVAAALGAVLATRLAELVPETRLLRTLLAVSAACLGLLGVTSSVYIYGVLRFIEVLCVAPVFPLVVARIALRAGGEAIGFINSARIGASFLGPVIATSMLAWTSTTVLYVTLAVLSLACVPLVDARAVKR